MNSNLNSPANDLNSMETASLTINDTAFEVWLAQTAQEQQYGLMFVTENQMAALPNGSERGMLFVFEDSAVRGFWMKDTIIPLDIAFADSEGVIVKIHTMTPLDLSIYSSEQLAQYALEVNAGLFSEKGVTEGDRIEIPAEVADP